MSGSQVQFRRNTAANLATFTGALGEAVIDTTNWCWRVHDGVTVGGYPQASQAYVLAQIGALTAGLSQNLTLPRRCI